MLLGSGQCPALDLERAGLPARPRRGRLGLQRLLKHDGRSSPGFLLQRLRYGAGEVSHLDALRWATAGSAACLGRDDIGRLARDCQADFALFNLDAERFSGAADPLAALVLCGADRADYVMVAGEWKWSVVKFPAWTCPNCAPATARRRRGCGRRSGRRVCYTFLNDPLSIKPRGNFLGDSRADETVLDYLRERRRKCGSRRGARRGLRRVHGGGRGTRRKERRAAIPRDQQLHRICRRAAWAATDYRGGFGRRRRAASGAARDG